MVERPWTKSVVTDASVEVYGHSGYRRSSEKVANELARALKELFKEHSEWRDIQVTIHTESEVRCTFCGLVYEEDSNGPLCCDNAIEAYQKMKAERPPLAFLLGLEVER